MSNTLYSVTVNGSNPADVGALVPTTDLLKVKLEEQSLQMCGCTAKPVRKILLKGRTEELKSKESAIQGAIRDAWAAENTGKKALLQLL